MTPDEATALVEISMPLCRTLGIRALKATPEKALAARAYVRHHHTDHEEAARGDRAQRQLLYREVKGRSHGLVDDFLLQHREQSGQLFRRCPRRRLCAARA